MSAEPIATPQNPTCAGHVKRLAAPVIRAFFPSAERAARTALVLAADPKLAGETGGYYRSGRRRERPLEFDAEESLRLWRTSAEHTRAEARIPG
jgi:hypothetical protein